MKNGEAGSGVQVWSSLPTETVGDYRELGFVHGSNRVPRWDETEFPHGDAARAYDIGYDYGVSQQNPEARNYAAGQHGRNVGENATPEERARIVRNLINGDEILAWQAGRDYARHERRYKRSIKA